jgi:UPF0755 protein
LTKKRIAKIVMEAALLAAAVVLGAWLYWLKCVEAVNTTVIPARIDLYEVKEGMTATKVSEDLLAGAIPSFAVRIWVKRHPELQPIQRGHYRIDGKLTLKEILALMVMGKTAEIAFPTLTIVEGSTITDVERSMKRYCGSCELALSELDVPAEFIITTLQSDPSLIKAIGGAASSLEGLLAPATYQFKSPRRINEALAQALRATAKLMKKEWPERSKSAYLKNPYEALIVASIIERETAIPEERPQVAAVFYNRMRKRMRLQTDPTVMYGVSPDFSGRLTKAQLRRDTPYNTYTRAGLPPTPISMPSKSSVLAALHPADSDALYFVAADIDPSNGHVFTKTLREHNRAVSDYRRKVSDYRKQQKDAAAKEAQEKAREQAKDQDKDQQQAADGKNEQHKPALREDKPKARTDAKKALAAESGSEKGASKKAEQNSKGRAAPKAPASDEPAKGGAASGEPSVRSGDGEVDVDLSGKGSDEAGTDGGSAAKDGRQNDKAA